MKAECFLISVWLWAACFGQISASTLAESFVNFETAPVHPVALGPDGRTLAVCNLPDGRVELLCVSSGAPVSIGDVPVGVDPVSVRFRTTNELWVVNHIGSSVSVVDVAKRRIVATLNTLAGPADVVFAGSPPRAFVSCARENTVQVFDPVTRQMVTNLFIDGERPKALAVSPDGTRVYAAIFESGNASTILAANAADNGLPGVLADSRGPYGGQWPAPNDGLSLNPPLYINPNINPNFYAEFAPVSLIVKKNANNRWMDDNHGDWTEFISGTNSSPYAGSLYNRPFGWDMTDRDLAIIDAASLDITYATGLMNICMDAAVNPASGKVAVIGTDARNEIRFEPHLRGTFLRVRLALVDPLDLTKTVLDLNPHLDYSTSSVPVSVRDQSIGEPRGIVWNAAGTRGYVTGMGSRNLVVIDAEGNRVTAQPVDLGDGPTGLALDEPRQRLYFLNRFAATVSALDLATLTVLTNVPLFDPTPNTIKVGRKHLYDTRKNSGLGHVACGSCHVDARFDRLAWDLGNPAADITAGRNRIFHPMKGPLVTQTLQDILGRDEPLHWRGDRDGIENFNVTFIDLLGADEQLTSSEMEEFKAFLETIRFPPNRFRNFDNSLPTNLPLPGLTGFAEGGGIGTMPLPNGNAVRGRDVFTRDCNVCHQLQTGFGRENLFEEALTLREGRPLKIAQLRSLPDKLGMNLSGTSSRAGFGFRFDGRDDSLTRFLLDINIPPNDNQELADLTTFLLAFSGTGLDPLAEAQGFILRDAVAAIGRQLTLTSPASNALFAAMLALADLPTSRVDLIARGTKDGLNRGWFYDRERFMFESDRNNEDLSPAALLALAAPDSELTFTVVPRGSGRRLGIDRDTDDYLDRTEFESGFDPADALSRGSNTPPQMNGLPQLVIHSGKTVTFAPNATDHDLPAQTLTFSLVAPAPAGATFDPATRAFTWTPAPDQSDRGTYRIPVRVTDNGLPPMSDLQTAEITVVGLRVLTSYRDESTGAFVVVFRTIPGHGYQLQFKDRLDDLDWLDVPDAFFGIAPFDTWALQDNTASSASQRFYRIYSAQ